MITFNNKKSIGICTELEKKKTSPALSKLPIWKVQLLTNKNVSNYSQSVTENSLQWTYELWNHSSCRWRQFKYDGKYSLRIIKCKNKNRTTNNSNDHTQEHSNCHLLMCQIKCLFLPVSSNIILWNDIFKVDFIKLISEFKQALRNI